ncbi:MAG: hypothetical protein P1P82_08200 [Bacteroidales bacterium]|nr:hypothetical protein [Bacteroidales bacterium]
MRKTILFITTFLVTLTCLGQDWDRVLRQELFSALNTPADSIYIEDRKHLEKVKGLTCSSDIINFYYTTKTGDKIEIQIVKGPFEPLKHENELVDTVYKLINGQKHVDYLLVKNIIDGRYSYGIDGTIPKSEIKSLTIKWNEQNLIIPDTAFSNLYQPHICLDNLQVEPYLTRDNKNLYIYLSGSDAAGGYSVKFIFDTRKYLTRIVGTNEMTNGYDFLDGTAKVNN